MTMSGDRLTRLPDAVLWQVLSHAPAKEAVCTGALSRPWRSLWLLSGVLNLDSRSYGAGPMRYRIRSLVFLRDANAALRAIATAAASDEGIGLRKLTFTYLDPYYDENPYSSRRHIDDGLDALLTGDPAARGLEELHVHVSQTNHYSLRLAALPSDALRVLLLDGLQLTPPCSPPPASFARLETLRLRRCGVRLTDLQAIVDAAPLLTVMELDHVDVSSERVLSSSGASAGYERLRASLGGCTGYQRLRCPQVTAISLADLRGMWYRLELVAPSLRHFAYRYREAEVLSVTFEQPGALGRAEQFKDMNLGMWKDAVRLRLY